MADDQDPAGEDASDDIGDDLQSMARQYLDLWEEHLASLGQDPAVAENMARTIELMNTGAAAFATMALEGINQAQNQAQAATPPAAATRSGDADEPAAGTVPADAALTDAAGAAADGHAHGAANADLDDLRRRLARLEERLERLESALAPGGKTAG